MPANVLPPNAKACMNLPDDDLVKGGAAFQSYNVSECYARCLAWNAAAVAWNSAAVAHNAAAVAAKAIRQI